MAWSAVMERLLPRHPTKQWAPTGLTATLFDYIRRAMPFGQQKSLSNDEVYAVTAYVLFLNGILEEDRTTTKATLPGIEMPNRDGFFWSEEARRLTGEL